MNGKSFFPFGEEENQFFNPNAFPFGSQGPQQGNAPQNPMFGQMMKYPFDQSFLSSLSPQQQKPATPQTGASNPKPVQKDPFSRNIEMLMNTTNTLNRFVKDITPVVKHFNNLFKG